MYTITVNTTIAIIANNVIIDITIPAITPPDRPGVEKMMIIINIIILVFQKPHCRSKVKDHIRHLERHLILWCTGLFIDLLNEGWSIQKRFKSSYKRSHDGTANAFSRLMFEGKIKPAFVFLTSWKGRLDSPFLCPVLFRLRIIHLWGLFARL